MHSTGSPPPPLLIQITALQLKLDTHEMGLVGHIDLGDERLSEQVS